jgi:hypothetical protein
MVLERVVGPGVVPPTQTLFHLIVIKNNQRGGDQPRRATAWAAPAGSGAEGLWPFGALDAVADT